MPSISKAQQAIMGQAWAVRQGDLKLKDLNPRWRDEIKKIAFGYKDDDGKFIAPMTDKELEKFAKTKSKNLPERVEDGEPVDENLKVIKSKDLPSFTPMMNFGDGINPIIPYLNPDSKKSKAGGKNLANLKDYRDWIKSSKK